MGKKAKKSNKRNKKYTGINAKQPTNVVRVHRVNAVVRSDYGQWAYDHRQLIKGVVIAIIVIVIIVAGFIAVF